MTNMVKRERIIAFREERKIARAIEDAAQKEGLDTSGFLRQMVRRSLGIIDGETSE